MPHAGWQAIPPAGAGTTALVAAKLGRNAIGVELNPDYVEMSRKRLAKELGMLCKITVDPAKLETLTS